MSCSSSVWRRLGVLFVRLGRVDVSVDGLVDCIGLVCVFVW